MALNEQGYRPIPETDAQRIVSPTLRCAFGADGVDLPANVRRRVAGSLAHKPLFMQAAELLKAGKAREAKAMLEQCLKQATVEDLKDVRYFGVFWQHGQALRQIRDEEGGEGSMDPVIQRFAEAIVRYPSAARSAHYVTVAELLKEHGGMMGERDAAAILQRGINALAGKNGRLSERMRELIASSELPATREYRPAPIHERAMHTSNGVNRAAGATRGYGEDWLSALLESDGQETQG